MIINENDLFKIHYKLKSYVTFLCKLIANEEIKKPSLQDFKMEAVFPTCHHCAVVENSLLMH